MRVTRRLLVLLPVLAVLFLSSAACREAQDGTAAADLVLRNGRIVTLDGERTEVSALAVEGAWIVALGDDQEIASYIGPDTQVIDLKGRLTIPGFIEGHGHFLSYGDSLSILDLASAGSWQEVVDQVAEAVSKAGPGEWIRGRGWHQEKWRSAPEPAVDGMPVHQALSAVSPDNPVLLGHASGHAAFANAKAMELAGVDTGTPDPAGGQLLRDSAGRPTGLLRETAQDLVATVAARQNAAADPGERLDQVRRKAQLAGEAALRHGVTSFHDAGVPFATIDDLALLEAEEALPIRLYVMARAATLEELEEGLPRVRSESSGDDYLVVRSIKRQIDGALGAHGAWLLEPYDDLPASSGLILESEEQILGTARLALRFGYQLCTHAIGDRANRRVLDLYEQAFSEEGGAGDHRWRIEHAQHLHPDDVSRFAELDVIASMQGVHCSSDAPWIPRRLGDDRAREGAYLWRTLLDEGVLINNGTDVPVERIDPIPSFYASVSRRSANGEVFYPAQAMTREEALYSYTVANAIASFEEQFKGSLEIGKLADIVVLSKDILTIPETEILEARVDHTILGGELRYSQPQP